MPAGPSTASGPARRPAGPLVGLGLVLAVVAVALASFLDVHASARPLTQRHEAVGVIAEHTTPVVGAHEAVLPGQRRARAPDYDQTAVGSSVAAEAASPSAFSRTEALSGRASSRQVSEMADAMRTTGWDGPPSRVVEANGRRFVVDGHHRLEAARRAGIDVPYEVVDPATFTRGQRAIMDELGVVRAPSRTVEGTQLHAEENLLGLVPDPTSIGLSALAPCPGRCGPLLSKFGIPWAVAR